MGGRDRLLALLFALQLSAAAVLGGFLVQALGDDGPPAAAVAAGTPVDLPGVAADPADDVPTAPTVAGTRPGTAAVPGTVARPGTAAGPVAGPTRQAPAAALPAAGGPAVAKGAPVRVGSIVTQTGAINFASAGAGRPRPTSTW